MNSTDSPTDAPTVLGWAPGRVNLIGDHTDYMGGLVMPMAIQFRTVIAGHRGGGAIKLTSGAVPGGLDVDLPVTDAAATEPRWGRHVAAVAQLLGTVEGLRGHIESDIPLGAGLSSSAAVSVAAALALDAPGDAIDIARLCQRAEQLATGVPCGVMDQMAVLAARRDHALLLDCSTMQVEHVPLPASASWWVVHSGQERELASSQYAQRRADCEVAERLVGPLPSAELADIEAIDDPRIRARARHVRSECRRVRDFAEALRAGDLPSAGRLMDASHDSLRDDFEVSSPALERVVGMLRGTPGVYGARLTGAGFGGCVVALCEPTVRLDGWQVTASDGALAGDRR